MDNQRYKMNADLLIERRRWMAIMGGALIMGAFIMLATEVVAKVVYGPTSEEICEQDREAKFECLRSLVETHGEEVSLETQEEECISPVSKRCEQR